MCSLLHVYCIIVTNCIVEWQYNFEFENDKKKFPFNLFDCKDNSLLNKIIYPLYNCKSTFLINMIFFHVVWQIFSMAIIQSLIQSLIIPELSYWVFVFIIFFNFPVKIQSPVQWMFLLAIDILFLKLAYCCFFFRFFSSIF